MSDEELDDLIVELFKDFEEIKFSHEGMSFYFEGKTPVFDLEINGQDGERFIIVYRPPVEYFKALLRDSLNSERITKDLQHLVAKQGKETTGSTAEFIKSFIETHKVFMFETIASSALLLSRAFETVFQQAAADVPVLWAELKNLQIDKMAATLRTRHLNEPLNFSLKTRAHDLAKRFAEQQKQSGKRNFLKAADLIPPDAPPKRFVFALFYDHLLAVWKEAQSFYKANRKRSNWRDMLRLDENLKDLPPDLIERLGSLDKEEKMPSSIALIHTARLCGIDENTPRRTLQQYLKESRDWLANPGRHNVEEILNEYDVPETLRPNVINASGIM